MKLPTILGKQLLKDHFAARMDDPMDAVDAVAIYQRMCLVGGMEMALAAVKPFFKPSCRVIKKDTPEWAALALVSETVKQDVLGLAMDALVGIVNAGMGSSKDKITAAAVLNDLFGDKQVIQDSVLTDKLVMNLVSNSPQ